MMATSNSRPSSEAQPPKGRKKHWHGLWITISFATILLFLGYALWLTQSGDPFPLESASHNPHGPDDLGLLVILTAGIGVVIRRIRSAYRVSQRKDFQVVRFINHSLIDLIETPIVTLAIIAFLMSTKLTFGQNVKLSLESTSAKTIQFVSFLLAYFRGDSQSLLASIWGVILRAIKGTR